MNLNDNNEIKNTLKEKALPDPKLRIFVFSSNHPAMKKQRYGIGYDLVPKKR